MSKTQNNTEKQAAELVAAELAATADAAAELAATAADATAAEAETAAAADATAGEEVKTLVKVTAKLFDMRDPFTKDENPWLFVGVEKEVELSNWVQAQIDAGYLTIVTAE